MVYSLDDPYFSYIRNPNRNPDKNNKKPITYGKLQPNNNNLKKYGLGFGIILCGGFMILKKYINI